MSYAFGAQIISLLVSVFASFWVSKFMTISEFGYYQLFLFYSTYVGLLQFGVSEGVYLENGGKTYCELDYKNLKQIFFNTLILEIIILLIGTTIVFLVEGDDNRRNIFILIAIYSITYLFMTFFGMLLQAVNKTEQYSKAIIIGKILTLIAFVMLVGLRIFNYIWYCLIFLIGYMVSGIFVTIKCRNIIFEKVRLKPVLCENRAIIIAGESLLLSGLVSSFMIGINRIYIDKFLGIEVFGKVSMSLSLINFFILFAIQIGMVIFPSIVILEEDDKAKVYRKLDDYSTLIMPAILIGYIPMKLILNVWIPQYEESIKWILLFFPYMVYEIRTQIMYNTYMKALRKEALLFIINLIAFIVCAIVNLIIILKLRNLELIFWVINIVMIIKSILLSNTIDYNYGDNHLLKHLIEALLCCIGCYIVYYISRIDYLLMVVISYIFFFILGEKILHSENRNN